MTQKDKFRYDHENMTEGMVLLSRTFEEETGDAGVLLGVCEKVEMRCE
jgi:hypothetical protein